MIRTQIIKSLLLLMLFISERGYCQTTSTFTAEEQEELNALDEFLTQADSTSIINLLDSLIRLEQALNKSQLVLKSGYNSESLVDNRESLGTERGLYSGISYYHKSGVFVDAQVFWNSQFDPQHYLTTASTGYMGLLGKHWSYIASYDHYFFNKQAETETRNFPYSDGLNVSGNFIGQNFETGVDYSIIFGDIAFVSHKLNYNLIGKISFEDVLFLNKVTLRPAVGLLWGNQSIYIVTVNRQFINPDRRFTVNEENEFGLLNISLLAPIYVTIKSFNLVIGYQFNLPQELPGENLAYSQSHVFSVSISYFIKG